jgi:membrane protease YdiL (CAAX protease family)
MLHLLLLLLVMVATSGVTFYLDLLLAPLLGYSQELMQSGPTIYEPSLSRFVLFTGSVAQFLLPPFVVAWLMVQQRTLVLLGLARRPKTSSVLLCVVAVVVAMPFISLMSDINAQLPLPEWFMQKESSIGELQESLLNTGSVGAMLLNLLVVALVPALGEELFFRGFIQRSLAGWTRNAPMAILLTAALFSAMHLQFAGFVPRFLLAAAFGYLFWWSRCLWLPIVAHFVHNAIPVLIYFVANRRHIKLDEGDFLSGTTLTVTALVSLFVLGNLLSRIKTIELKRI